MFNFSEGGKERGFVRFFASMAYNVHILGDYMTDNSELTGLNALNNLMGKIIIELRDFDPLGSKVPIKELQYIMNLKIGTQQKADKLMESLKKNVPSIVKNAREGSIYRRLSKGGFKFNV